MNGDAQIQSVVAEHVVGIEMSDSHVTFSILKGAQSPRLVHVDRRVLRPGSVKNGAVVSPQAVVSVLAPLVDDFTRYPAVQYAFSIPTARISSHTFTLPADCSDQDIEAALRSQADEYFPYDEKDCAIWWRIVQKTDQTVTVFACATSRAFVHSWLEVCAEAGIHISFFDIEPMNMLRSVMPSVSKHEAVIVVDIGRRMTYISAIDAHGIRELKVLSCPMHAFTEIESDEQLTDRLRAVVHETVQMTHALEELRDRGVAHILVCGYGSRIERVLGVLRRELPYDIRPYVQVVLPVDPGIDALFMGGLPFEYANSVGVALGGALRPDFAPRM